jgi:hypothetical protein
MIERVLFTVVLAQFDSLTANQRSRSSPVVVRAPTTGAAQRRERDQFPLRVGAATANRTGQPSPPAGLGIGAGVDP